MRLVSHIILAFLLLAGNCFAADLFVSTTGSDAVLKANNDIDNPWLTISHAISQLAAGDTLYVRAGTYAGVESINFTVAATAELPILITAYPGDATPVIQGTFSGNGLDNTYTFYFNGAEHVAISHLWFEEVRFGIGYLTGNSPYRASYITLDHIKMTNTNDVFEEGVGSLMLGMCDHVEITHSYFSNAAAHNILIYSLAYNITVSNNFITGGGEGIYCKHGSTTGIHTYSNNIIKDINRGYSICVNANYTTVENNLIYQTTATADRGGIIVHTNTHPSDYGVINHNTIYGTTNLGIFLNIEDSLYPQPTTVTNNLLYNAGHSTVSGLTVEYKPSLTTSDYNLVYLPSSTTEFGVIVYTHYTLDDWRTEMGAGFDTHSIHAAPTFVNGSGSMNTANDFVLTAGSQGKAACADGSDMGANIALVGIDASGTPAAHRAGGAPSGGSWSGQ